MKFINWERKGNFKQLSTGCVSIIHMDRCNILNKKNQQKVLMIANVNYNLHVHVFAEYLEGSMCE